MNDIEKMAIARSYIDLLSDGIDPVTNEKITAETLENPTLKEYLKLASEIISNKIDQFNKMKKIERPLKSFFITKEQCAEFRFSDKGLKISEISDEINRITESNMTRRLPVEIITKWLESEGLLIKNDINERVPTEKGKSYGIINKRYKVDNDLIRSTNYYGINAQAYIIGNIDKIVKLAWQFQVLKFEGNPDKIEVPNDIKIRDFLEKNQKKCFIMSVGSCDYYTNVGSYNSVLYYNGKTKSFKEDNIDTNSSNKCILYGLIEAASAIKSPVDVVILTSAPVGFNTPKSVNHDLCNNVIGILKGIGCDISICVCENMGDELRKVIHSFE